MGAGVDRHARVNFFGPRDGRMAVHHQALELAGVRQESVPRPHVVLCGLLGHVSGWIYAGVAEEGLVAAGEVGQGPEVFRVGLGDGGCEE